jgi:cytochrome oxidase Cu insertion factor (SCO1/SenC/PrrC family)
MVDTAPPARPATRGRRTLLLIAAVAIAPVVASYVTYYFFPRDTQVNYGTLLPTAPAPAVEGVGEGGRPFRLADLKGKWVLVVSGGGRCDAVCARALYATRQARTMQGREQERVARAWLVTDDVAPSPAQLAEHAGLVVARVPPAAAAALPGGAAAIYLVDPLGNLVLRYSEDPDIKALAKDLGRLLKASQIG